MLHAPTPREVRHIVTNAYTIAYGSDGTQPGLLFASCTTPDVFHISILVGNHATNKIVVVDIDVFAGKCTNLYRHTHAHSELLSLEIWVNQQLFRIADRLQIDSDIMLGDVKHNNTGQHFFGYTRSDQPGSTRRCDRPWHPDVWTHIQRLLERDDPQGLHRIPRDMYDLVKTSLQHFCTETQTEPA